MELLRFATAGSVDDGKSTLIGRLLYDSKQIFEDTLDALEHTSRLRGEEEVNLALLTDGLRAEREQGITIDVAYRYFATPKRKFIIADTPGHIQYTRNMITGASTANLALILVDARNGILEQSRRHAFLASLLGVPHLVLCVNKMDLVDYDQAVFERIKSEFRDFATKLDVHDLAFIPVSALRGDNVVDRSDNTPWYEGTSLLHHLEEVHIGSDRNLIDCRFAVQYVIRPRNDAFHDYRGYAGQVQSGTYKPGDEVVVLPSGFTSTIAAIDTADGPVEEATPPMSVTIRLDRRPRREPRRHDLPAAQPPAGRPGRRRDALLVQRARLAHAGREVRDQAHEQLGARAREGPPVPPRREHAAPRRVRELAVAERDRPGDAAHDQADPLRRVPPQPRDGVVHPRRRGQQRHRRRGHDRLCSMVHEVAAAGFSDPADYEAARPSYPPDAVAWLVEHLHIEPGRRVVDLAAGTGKLTRLLAPAGRRPHRGRARCRACARRSAPWCPASRSSATTAEQLAFRDASLDAVTVAQAFHWFDHDRAIAELARVAPAGRSGRARLERARPQRRVGRRGVGDHGPRREARAVARPRRLERQRVHATCPASGRCTPPSSATSRRSRPRRWSSGSRR